MPRSISATSDEPTLRVAIAGASGFVGSHLIDHLEGKIKIRALSRSANVVSSHKADRPQSIEWKQCDLYSLPKVSAALKDCDCAIYLVHSMSPSSRLVQSSFEDTDLLLADNFIRGAEAAGLKQVIYLSGLMPEEGDDPSPHLRSRREVEQVMRSRGVPVTVLRSGLIFGPGGSSFSMLINLVQRLPVMILPAWVRSQTHSIDINNICQAVEHCLQDEDLQDGTYDLSGHHAVSYREMIEKTASTLGRRRLFINFPFNCFKLSKHWVALFGSVNPALVGPLQESLKHDLVAKPNPLQDRLEGHWVSFEQSLKRSVTDDGKPKPNPHQTIRKADRKVMRKAKRVRSIQRMNYPTDWSADRIAEEYAAWLSRKFRGLINAETDSAGVIHFRAFSDWLTLLELSPTPHSEGNPRRRAFYISDGLLSRKVEPMGRLEFRLFPELSCMVSSIHDFAPTLPWWLYVRTQALVHLRVMHAFARHSQGLMDQR